jgi:ring-1,2-phenylacetyl-CoA epoxidase subunit PaaC
MTALTDNTQATTWMAAVIGSLADNKAALGRRYAQWGVSARTLESAVAAAAMAQDEMGHARSTYPVLKALGADAGDEGLDGRGHRLALLDDELPDWAAFIAANLLVDGVLTTFVAACVDSTVEPMAARAKKILQEEGSHRVHAEAWAKRICHAGGPERDLLVTRLRETWEQAARWTGPDDDPGMRAAWKRARSGAAPPRSAPRSATGCRTCSPAKGSSSRSASPPTGPAGTRSAADGTPDLPVLRLARHRARRPVGRADHHRPMALLRLRELLRSRARRLRRGTLGRLGNSGQSTTSTTTAAPVSPTAQPVNSPRPPPRAKFQLRMAFDLVELFRGLGIALLPG